jgi:hypothetical protein
MRCASYTKVYGSGLFGSPCSNAHPGVTEYLTRGQGKILPVMSDAIDTGLHQRDKGLKLCRQPLKHVYTVRVEVTGADDKAKNIRANFAEMQFRLMRARDPSVKSIVLQLSAPAYWLRHIDTEMYFASPRKNVDRGPGYFRSPFLMCWIW